jgi:hypothetical protein
LLARPGIALAKSWCKTQTNKFGGVVGLFSPREETRSSERKSRQETVFFFFLFFCAEARSADRAEEEKGPGLDWSETRGEKRGSTPPRTFPRCLFFSKSFFYEVCFFIAPVLVFDSTKRVCHKSVDALHRGERGCSGRRMQS